MKSISVQKPRCVKASCTKACLCVKVSVYNLWPFGVRISEQILQLARVHCMELCNVTSVHCAELCRRTILCSSAKLTSTNCMMLASFGALAWQHSETKSLYTVECWRSIRGQILMHRIVFAARCNYYFEIDICLFLEARSCKRNDICSMLKLSSAHCT